jgi:hypothetical protein
MVPRAGIEPARLAAADFKSATSTYFVIEARICAGGGGRNRTGVDGFAGRCMTTLPPRRVVLHFNRYYTNK